ncbi:MAG: hypothetical protein H6740_14895 [Alphaproteobacteria bacterium]|nr:hypothetical protein [Alphaproteobacteria bacterium]
MTQLAQFGLFIPEQAPGVPVQEELLPAVAQAGEASLDLTRVEPEVESPSETTGWPEELEEAFEERAGAMEFEGGLPRAEAEHLARREVALAHGLPWQEPIFPEERFDLEGFAVHAPPGAMEKVVAIAPLALELGWTEAQLLSTRGRLRFPSPDYGLVCYLDPGARVVEVTPKWVALEGADGARTRFFNRARPQAWHISHPERAGPAASP